MSEDVIQQEDSGVQDDAEAMASMMAGYNKTARAVEAPVVEVELEPEELVTEPEEIVEEPVPQEPSVADELRALKAKVSALASTSDPDVVRKMHGEIGEINRTLKQLASPKVEEAPVKDELTAAFEAAEKSAEEFPEINGPLVKALKAAISIRQAPQPEAQPVDIGANVSTEVEKRLKASAIEALAEEHPDYETVRDTPEFKKWEATKTPEFQQRLRNTWNPAVVSRGLTEFKESLKLRQKKQERLAASVVPQGTQQKAGASVLNDEEGLWAGYNKGRNRFNKR